MSTDIVRMITTYHYHTQWWQQVSYFVVDCDKFGRPNNLYIFQCVSRLCLCIQRSMGFSLEQLSLINVRYECCLQLTDKCDPNTLQDLNTALQNVTEDAFQ